MIVSVSGSRSQDVRGCEQCGIDYPIPEASISINDGVPCARRKNLISQEWGE
jgi:hypothetical protein